MSAVLLFLQQIAKFTQIGIAIISTRKAGIDKGATKNWAKHRKPAVYAVWFVVLAPAYDFFSGLIKYQRATMAHFAFAITVGPRIAGHIVQIIVSKTIKRTKIHQATKSFVSQTILEHTFRHAEAQGSISLNLWQRTSGAMANNPFIANSEPFSDSPLFFKDRPSIICFSAFRKTEAHPGFISSIVRLINNPLRLNYYTHKITADCMYWPAGKIPVHSGKDW
ncbi:MAG: hypothetical protein OEL50_05840 [Rhodospirillaceae bacterium]|nr:hypothetical protein [Rhodospirillaceae bacterium]